MIKVLCVRTLYSISNISMPVLYDAVVEIKICWQRLHLLTAAVLLSLNNFLFYLEDCWHILYVC